MIFTVLYMSLQTLSGRCSETFFTIPKHIYQGISKDVFRRDHKICKIVGQHSWPANKILGFWVGYNGQIKHIFNDLTRD